VKIVRLLLIFLVVFSVQVRAQSITGIVSDEDGNPVPFARVYALNFENLGAVTNVEGAFLFGCDFGNYDLLVKCLGFEDKVVNVTVSTQAPTEVNIILLRKQNELITVDVSEKKKKCGLGDCSECHQQQRKF
jgi:hypothetical protein